ncbi:MAG: hypothetical protein ABSC29_01725 [Minisyncoccia bacterium]|jgi:hypothetical protein
MEEENKNGESPKQEGGRKSAMRGIFIGILVFAVIFGVIAMVGSSGSNSGNPSAPSAPSGCSDPNLQQQAQTIDYKQLEKDPGSFNGTIAEFTGQILQIQQSDSQGIIRLAVDKLFGDAWNPGDVVYVSYQGSTNAVQGDIVNVYGPLTGSQTYTSQANFHITVPSMTGCVIEEASSSAAAATVPPPAPAVPTPTQKQNPAPVTGQATPNSAPQIPATSPTPKTWHTATTVTAATTENTPPFNIQGTQWRATWSCQAALPVNTTPTVFAESTDGLGGDSVAEPNTCPSGNTTYFYDGPGTYYLKINIYDPATMTITIEDYY